MTEPIIFSWSEHAEARWRERSATDESMSATILGARLAGRRVLNRIRNSCTHHAEVTKHGQWTGFHYLTNHGWVFVMASRVVVTCFKL